MTEFAFSDIIDWDSLDEAGRTEILRRPAVMAGERISAVVKDILDNVEKNGDQALREYSAKFDRTEVKNFRISKEEVDAAWERVSPDFRAALQRAARNIEKFHTAEKLEPVVVETMPGVRCEQVTRPIEAVGLYIPGGTAPLFSTVLMLGIPARIAGCSKVVLCTPPPVADQMVFITHGDCLEDAEYVADKVRERFGVRDVVINYVDPVIGAHSGPGTMALFYMAESRN